MNSYTKMQNTKVVNPHTKSHGLTRVATGLTRLPAGLRVQTHIKAGLQLNFTKIIWS
jgi:hypothetical protein